MLHHRRLLAWRGGEPAERDHGGDPHRRQARQRRCRSVPFPLSPSKDVLATRRRDLSTRISWSTVLSTPCTESSVKAELGNVLSTAACTCYKCCPAVMLVLCLQIGESAGAYESLGVCRCSDFPCLVCSCHQHEGRQRGARQDSEGQARPRWQRGRSAHVQDGRDHPGNATFHNPASCQTLTLMWSSPWNTTLFFPRKARARHCKCFDQLKALLVVQTSVHIANMCNEDVQGMKEDFIVVHLREPCSFCRKYISGSMRCAQ